MRLVRSRLVGNVAGQPVQALIQTLSRGGAGALNVPVAHSTTPSPRCPGMCGLHLPIGVPSAVNGEVHVLLWPRLNAAESRMPDDCNEDNPKICSNEAQPEHMQQLDLMLTTHWWAVTADNSSSVVVAHQCKTTCKATAEAHLPRTSKILTEHLKRVASGTASCRHRAEERGVCARSPVALAQRVQPQLVSDFRSSHRVGEILLVGKHQQHCIAQLILQGAPPHTWSAHGISAAHMHAARIGENDFRAWPQDKISSIAARYGT